MKTLKPLLLIALVLVLYSCSVFKKSTSQSNISINGKLLKKERGKVKLSSNEISIEFDVRPYNREAKKHYAAKIAVTDNKEDLIYWKKGEIKSSNPFFYNLTGIASKENNLYDCFYLTPKGHHYIYFRSDEDKRANVVSKSSNKIRLKWDVDCFYINNQNIPFSNSKIEKLYIMFFFDNNLNETIEAGEYKIYTLKFDK